jgi:two-component system sensor histidine kinase KdpD
MGYLLGIALVAARYGRGPTFFATLLSVAAFDFSFVPPRFTFSVSDVRYVLTFVVLFAIAAVISTLTLRIRDQATAARERERHTAALYAMTRELAATRGVTDLITIATRHVQDAMGGAAAILLPDGDGHVATPGGVPGPALDEKERSVAQWAFEHTKEAGRGTGTLPGSEWRYLPLMASAGAIGVLGVRLSREDHFDTPLYSRLLETFAAQAALALERAVLAERAQREQVEIEAERLRTSLLSSVSHDLRTPLGVITGSASSLLDSGTSLSDTRRKELLQSIVDEAQRMNQLIGNLLEMIRLESGSLRVQKEWQPLEETVGVALIRLADRTEDHPVSVNLPPDLPLVPVDAVLLEQVFINLVENAVKYTPAGTPIEITARPAEKSVLVTVADRGPGLPPGGEARVFEKFYRAAHGATATGVGLGLTICRGIVLAHGGRIWAENRPGGGAAFHFTIPLTGVPPVVPAETE